MKSRKLVSLAFLMVAAIVAASYAITVRRPDKAPEPAISIASQPKDVSEPAVESIEDSPSPSSAIDEPSPAADSQKEGDLKK